MPDPAATPAIPHAATVPAAAIAGPSTIHLRRARAADLPAIEEIIRVWAERGVLLPFGGAALRAALPDFLVLSSGARSGDLLAFGALRSYSPALAEIRSLVVTDGHRGRGLGRRLVGHLLEEARIRGLRRVFVLTRTPALFERLGFRRVARESLPEKVYADCNHCARRDRCDEQALVMVLT